jgi:hypothetical protein
MPPIGFSEFIHKFSDKVNAAVNVVVEGTKPFSVRYQGLGQIAQNTVPQGVSASRWKEALAAFIHRLNRSRTGDDPIVDINTFQKDYKGNIENLRNKIEPNIGPPKVYQSWMSRKIRGWQSMDPLRKAKRLQTLNNNLDPYRTRRGEELVPGTAGYNAIQHNRMERTVKAFGGQDKIPRAAYKILGLPDPGPDTPDVPDEKMAEPPESELRIGSPTPGRPSSPTREERPLSKMSVIQLLVQEGAGTLAQVTEEYDTAAQLFHEHATVEFDNPAMFEAVLETIRERHAVDPREPEDEFAEGDVSMDPALSLLNASGSYNRPANNRPDIRPVKREGLSDTGSRRSGGPNPMRLPQHYTIGGGQPLQGGASDHGTDDSDADLYYSDTQNADPAAELISANDYAAMRPPNASERTRPVRVIRPGRLRDGKPLPRMTGGIAGWDVQRRPNFSIQEISAKTFVLVAREVTSGVYAQIKNLLGRVKGQFLIVDSQRLSKRQALDYIMPALRKGSVHVEIP